MQYEPLATRRLSCQREVKVSTVVPDAPRHAQQALGGESARLEPEFCVGRVGLEVVAAGRAPGCAACCTIRRRGRGRHRAAVIISAPTDAVLAATIVLKSHIASFAFTPAIADRAVERSVGPKRGVECYARAHCNPAPRVRLALRVEKPRDSLPQDISDARLRLPVERGEEVALQAGTPCVHSTHGGRSALHEMAEGDRGSAPQPRLARAQRAPQHAQTRRHLRREERQLLGEHDALHRCRGI
mmetsp:Transcript_6335/g.25503  ORF Transcript_6335/g.25503 Transcript_6335/m.25503 type:complete len:243 (+) Transcript_6335:2135-2863(+)